MRGLSCAGTVFPLFNFAPRGLFLSLKEYWTATLMVDVPPFLIFYSFAPPPPKCFGCPRPLDFPILLFPPEIIWRRVATSTPLSPRRREPFIFFSSFRNPPFIYPGKKMVFAAPRSLRPFRKCFLFKRFLMTLIPSVPFFFFCPISSEYKASIDHVDV